MPVNSQPRLTARPLSRPSQPPPPPPIKAPKTENASKGAFTVMRDGSADAVDALKVSGMLHEDKKNSRRPSSQKQNFPQINPSFSTKGSGFPATRKPAPPVPTKPAHLQRNCLTPPPKPGNLSTVLGVSSYSLPEYELSDLEHPQLSSTLMSQALPTTQALPKDQPEVAKSEPEPKPPQVPVRRESMKKINDMMLRESKISSTSVSPITSFEESFITRFRPVTNFPAPEIFTSCEKTYPSREQGSLAGSKSGQVIASGTLVSEGGCANPPPLPSTAPPTRSISDNIINKHNPVMMAKQAQLTVPPPPPLPVGNNSSAVKSSESTIPPPPPLPSPATCPVVPLHASSAAKPGVQASTLSNQAKEQQSEAVDNSPISVTRFVKSEFAVNLSKLYGTTKRTEECFPGEPPLLAAKPRPPPLIKRKPELVIGNWGKLPQKPPSLRMKQPSPAVTPPNNTISSSASSMLAVSSPVNASVTNTSPDPKPPRSVPPTPPPAPFRTSSLSTSPPPHSTPPGFHLDKASQGLSRSQSVRAAPPPPVPAHSSGLDRSHSARPSSTSSSPLAHSSEAMTRKYSFRAAPPPPPQSAKPTEAPGREPSSQGSSRLGGHLQTHKLLIC